MAAGVASADERVVDPDAVGRVVLGHIDDLVVDLAVGPDAGQHLSGRGSLGGDAERVLVRESDGGRQVLSGAEG